MATGTTGTPASSATIAAPGSAGRMPPSSERVPSGNISTASPLRRWLRAVRNAPMSAEKRRTGKAP